MTTLAELSNLATEYSQAYSSNQISKEEYIELMRGLKVSEAIEESAEDMQNKIRLQQGIDMAIHAASLVA